MAAINVNNSSDVNGSFAMSGSPVVEDNEIGELEAEFNRLAGGVKEEALELVEGVRKFIREARDERCLKAPSKALLKAFNQMASESDLTPEKRLVSLVQLLEAIDWYKGTIFEVHMKAEGLLGRLTGSLSPSDAFHVLSLLRDLKVSPRLFLGVETFEKLVVSAYECKDDSLFAFLMANRPPKFRVLPNLLDRLRGSYAQFEPEKYQTLRKELLDELFALPEEKIFELADARCVLFIQWCKYREKGDLVQRYAAQLDPEEFNEWEALLKALELAPSFQKVAESVVQTYVDAHLKTKSFGWMIHLLTFLIENPDCHAKEKIEESLNIYLAEIVKTGHMKALFGLINWLPGAAPFTIQVSIDRALEAVSEKVIQEGEEISRLLREKDWRKVEARIAEMPFFSSQIKGAITRENLEEKLIQFLFKNIEGLSKRKAPEAQIERLFDLLGRLSLSFPLIEGIIKRDGVPFCAAELRLIEKLKRELPDQNKARVGFELMQKETQQMDLRRFRKEELVIGKDRFEAFDTHGAEFRFFVHAAGLDEGSPEKVVREKLDKGFVCVSLLSQSLNGFFGMEVKYGLVLAVNPKDVVATYKEDIRSPYKDKEDPLKFYRLAQRAQLLSGYIDKLYRESGAQGNSTTDEFSRLNRLMSLLSSGWDPRIEEEVQALLRKMGIRRDQIQQIYEETGVVLRKLEEALRPENRAKASPETVKELERCLSLIEEIKMDRVLRHFHPLVSPGELLRLTPFQTPNYFNNWSYTPYNEANLDLRTRDPSEKDPMQVRAILIDRKTFQTKSEEFRAIFENARERGIPILIRENPPLSPGVFLQAIKLGNAGVLLNGFQEGGVDEATIAQGILLAAEEGPQWILDFLLQKVDVGDEILLQAFRRAVAKNNTSIIESFLMRPRMEVFLNEAVQAYLGGNKEVGLALAKWRYWSSDLPAELVEKFDRVLPSDLVSDVFRYLMKEENTLILGVFLREKRFRDQLDSSEIKESIAYVIENGFESRRLQQLIQMNVKLFGPYAIQYAALQGDKYWLQHALRFATECTVEDLKRAWGFAKDLEIKKIILDKIREKDPLEPGRILKEAEQNSLLERAAQFASPVLTTARATAIQEIAPSLGVKEARELAHLIFAGIESSAFHPLLVKRLSKITESEFWAVRVYLSRWIQLSKPAACRETLRHAVEDFLPGSIGVLA